MAARCLRNTGRFTAHGNSLSNTATQAAKTRSPALGGASILQCGESRLALRGFKSGRPFDAQLGKTVFTLL
ncbi:hypothetical protein [Lysobacter gummosus]|uniref:hypothetical protein n=1 Tax=Lysobacter gummosus TaxID=262324 RepID=UPI0036429BA5